MQAKIIDISTSQRTPDTVSVQGNRKITGWHCAQTQRWRKQTAAAKAITATLGLSLHFVANPSANQHRLDPFSPQACSFHELSQCVFSHGFNRQLVQFSQKRPEPL